MAINVHFVLLYFAFIELTHLLITRFLILHIPYKFRTMKNISVCSFLFCLFLLCGNGFYSNAQGAGNAINFGGSASTNPSVRIKNTFPNLTTDFSITAWIKTTNGAQIGQRIFQDDESKNTGYGFSLGDPGGTRLRFYSRGTSSTGTVLIVDGGTDIGVNTWAHVAVVVNITAKTVTLYVNGIQDGTGNDTRAGTWGTDGGRASFGGETPSSGEAGNGYYIRGQEDEIIVWNKALSQTEIRNIMCAKQNSGNANILAYWNLDGTITTGGNGVPELTANGYSGSLAASMATTDVVTSGAALGDVSTYNYSPATWTGVTLTLPAAANLTTFTVSNVTPVSGATAPSGIQLYQVSAAPSITTGIVGLGNNNVYYGVFPINGTSPTYDATINYTNYIQTSNGQVYLRTDNSTTPWTAGGTNTSGTTFTIATTGVTTRKEFILGTSNAGNPLPIELTDFSVKPEGKKVAVNWTTVTETNNKYFTIERSRDGQNFTEIATENSKATNGNSLTKLDYKTIDNNPLNGTSYYRLRQTDFNGKTKTFNIASVNFSSNKNLTFTIYPNPNEGQFTIDFSGIENNHEIEVKLFDLQGKVVYSESFYSGQDSGSFNIIPAEKISKGSYVCTLIVEGVKQTIKVIVN